MQSVHLKFYVTEKQRHEGALLYEWLLGKAKELGLPGGSAFRAIAGFGRHGRLHEESFFELAGELPVQVEFVLNDGMADRLLDALRPHQLNLFYVRYAVESGVL
jgi:PII-like signaling protein